FDAMTAMTGVLPKHDLRPLGRVLRRRLRRRLAFDIPRALARGGIFGVRHERQAREKRHRRPQALFGHAKLTSLHAGHSYGLLRHVVQPFRGPFARGLRKIACDRQHPSAFGIPRDPWSTVTLHAVDSIASRAALEHARTIERWNL